MRSSRITKILIISILSLIGVCLLLTVVSAISNLGLPQASPVLETLGEADKIRLAETQHLIQNLGSNIWNGWGEVDIPAILYNESYAFLLGYPGPPAGWIKVPANIKRGSEWEVTPGDTYSGQPYYRQRLLDPDISPEAFTVLVGERWVSSMGTLDWIKISLAQTIRQEMPGFLRPIFPYRFFIQRLVSGSDQYISLIAHETFHAYQGMTAPDKLAESERTNSAYSSRYPRDDPDLQADWQRELDLLAEALRSTDEAKTIELARRFLVTRVERRASANLTQELIAYEQQREWLEGLARFTELEIWRLASAGGYTPLPETAQLSDFDGYSGYASRWSQELGQISRMADDEGDGHYYYTGMAQAYLLDGLRPDWKTRAFDEDVWLEDLLEEAVR